MTTTSSGTWLESMSRDKPFYVLYRDRVIKNIADMSNAFRKRYSNFTIAYSFKTNYLKPIIDEVTKQRGMAEVVSPYEYKYATEGLMLHPCRVVYNGVTPDPVEKFDAASNLGIVNVDNIDEYIEISKIAHSRDIPIKIGVRVNFPISNGLCSRFGLDIHGKDFRVLMQMIEDNPLVSLKGFHVHIGTARPAKFWKEKITTMIDLAKRYNVEYIDLGGGMYGPMISELAVQFDDYAWEFDDYAKAVCQPLNEAFPDNDVMLIVEPGTALVGNTMDLYCHVTDIKDVRGKTYITVDTCSNHIGMICECRVIPMTVLHTGDAIQRVTVTDATVAGCTCLEFDYIRKSFSGDIAIGDTIRFENVGAYSIGASRQFIVPRPAVIDANSGEVLRPAEEMLDMFHKYIR